MTLLSTFLLVMILIVLYELGHIVVAKIIGLEKKNRHNFETNPFFSDFTIAVVTNIAEKQKIAIDEHYYQEYMQNMPLV